MERSEGLEKLTAAFIAAQADLQNIHPDSTGKTEKFSYKYVSLGLLIDATKPILQKHGLAITQFPASQNAVTSVLMHSSGQWMSETTVVPELEARGMSAVQAAGAAITYARRYAWASICGIASDEDTDAAGEPKKAPPKSPLKLSNDSEDVKQLKVIVLAKMRKAKEMGLYSEQDLADQYRFVESVHDAQTLQSVISKLNEKIGSA